jgi:hypothetical protein
MMKHHTTEQIIRILREAEGSQMKANLVSGSNAQTPFTGNRTDRFFRLAE